jgi:hypothetical protein
LTLLAKLIIFIERLSFPIEEWEKVKKLAMIPMDEPSLEVAYCKMAQDEARETEALEWEEAALRDMGDECMK